MAPPCILCEICLFWVADAADDGDFCINFDYVRQLDHPAVVLRKQDCRMSSVQNMSANK